MTIKLCVHCGGAVQEQATVCKHCGRDADLRTRWLRATGTRRSRRDRDELLVSALSVLTVVMLVAIIATIALVVPPHTGH